MKNSTFSKLLAVAALLLIGFTTYSQDRFGGLTLYTLRKEMNADPDGTLQKVADIGYQFIEATTYKEGKFYDMLPEAFNKKLTELGLVPLSVHMGMVTLDNADQLIADTKAAGFQYFVAPVPPMGLVKYNRETQSLSMTSTLDSLVSVLNIIGQKCKAAGLTFLYHNHDFEFKQNSEGIVPIEYMLENLDTEYVNFQIDLYWAVKAGVDPVAYFEKYPNRFKVWHVKDMDEQGRFAPVGTGSIDFKRLLAYKAVSGMQHYIVEQDQTFDGMQPIESVKISHEGLKKLGFN